MTKSKSNELFEKAKKVIPGGVMSNYRKDENFSNTYFSHGIGGRVYDIDGNEYIDFSLGYSPGVLGYSNDALIDAIKSQASKMYINNSNELEYEAAKLITEVVPGADLVRFFCSGTEANYNAIRIARGYTGKNMLVKFNAHYHGCLDNLLGGIIKGNDPIPEKGYTEEDFYSIMTDTAGRAKHGFDDTYQLEFNDLEAVKKLFETKGNEIACVILEPIMINMSGCLPKKGFLEGLRKLCDKHNIVLIFDEVITGFRLSLGGAGEYFGVTPDMSTFAKAIGGGFPVSAVVGKKEVMDIVTSTDVIAAGTYNGHPLAMASVIATIKELKKNNCQAIKHIHKIGKSIRVGLEKLSIKHNKNLLMQGFDGAITFKFTDKKEVTNHLESLTTENPFLKGVEFAGYLKQEKVLTSFRFCPCAAHTKKDVYETLERAEKALLKM